MEMSDLVKIYESLLNEYASIEKECLYYSIEYAREFGNELEELFQLKVDVITLKKKIAFCVKKKYRNEPIYQSDLDRYIDDEILEWQEKLEELVEYNKAAKAERHMLEYDEYRKLKKIYYEIVHLIHPDLHPEYNDDEEISDLWNRAVYAYKTNNYKEICIVYDHVIIKVKETDIFIEDIENKIDNLKEEINEIKENEPYRYKFLLEDDDSIQERHAENQHEIKDYKEYKESLEKEIKEFIIMENYDA